MTAEDLDLARLSLEIAVDQLTKPEDQGRRRDDGTSILTPVPPLLAQLEAAKGANSGSSGAFSAASKPPLWIDAVSLLAEIDRVVRRFDRAGRLAQVRAWSAAMHALTDRDALVVEVERAEAWVVRARALLEPSASIDLAGPCLRCGRAWTHAVNDVDEVVRRAALRATEADRITGSPAAWCEACAHRYQGEELWLLADHLHRQTATETLAVDEGPST